jgi:hypothetical protein
MRTNDGVAGNSGTDHAKCGCDLINGIDRRRFTGSDRERHADLIRIAGRNHARCATLFADLAMHRVARIIPIPAADRAEVVSNESATGAEAMAAGPAFTNFSRQKNLQKKKAALRGGLASDVGGGCGSELASGEFAI